MLGKRSHRESIGKQSWRIGVRIMPGILLVAALRFTAKRYVVQEALVVLFLVGVSTRIILVLGVLHEIRVDELLGRSLVVFCTFITLFAFRELQRVLGEDNFRTLFFRTGDPATSGLPGRS